jgi:glycyl-tRNA synthetase
MADTNASPRITMDKIVSLCKRRGFVFQSSEIYGGLGSCWDYGPLGVELKRNIKDAWWRSMVRDRDDVVGLDAAIMMHPRVWEASGHIAGFSDPLVECKNCHARFRADDLKSQACESCGGPLTEPKMFNLMFKTNMGPVDDGSSVIYLRPETAQGIFVNFDNVITTTRRKLPLGIAQQGKSFRNEITPGNFIFRTREFEQMEMEFFCKPGSDEQWFSYWVEERFKWYVKHGIHKENLRLSPHPREALAHYAKACTDIEYLFPMGWSELEGIANRTDFDLKAHAKYSGKALDYFDDSANERYVPYVIEPSAGTDRSALAFIIDAYDEDTAQGEARSVLRFHPSIAPVKVAILPLSRNEKLAPLSKQVHNNLRGQMMCQYDDAQSIGRRYRRQDEIGTPLCVTIDFQSPDDNQVTIRDRDSMSQVRAPIATLAANLTNRLGGAPLEGVPVNPTSK